MTRAVAAAAFTLLLTTLAQPAAQELRSPRLGDDRLVGLEWTFVRIRYSWEPGRLRRFRQTYWSARGQSMRQPPNRTSLAGWQE